MGQYTPAGMETIALRCTVIRASNLPTQQGIKRKSRLMHTYTRINHGQRNFKIAHSLDKSINIFVHMRPLLSGEENQ